MNIDKNDLKKLNDMTNETIEELVTELKKTGDECDELRGENKRLLESNTRLRKDVVNSVMTPDEPKPKEKMKTWEDWLKKQQSEPKSKFIWVEKK